MKPIEKGPNWARLGFTSYEEYREQLRRQNQLALMEWGLVFMAVFIIVVVSLIVAKPQ